MKKLMFAAAIAASAAAFADPINSIGFAGYDLGATFTTGQAEKDESGNDKAATYGYFCFLGGESDSSVVTNDNPSTTKHTAAFAEATDTKYLALDTEGGTLWRSINTLSYYPIGENDAVYSNGTARAVAATGTYLDTLVQFTVTEDEAPTVGENDKLAIWLQAGEGTTNLMVKAGYYDDTGTFIPGGKEFTLTGKTIEPGVWYRLTVKVMDDIFITNEDIKNPAFTISIDGDPLNATEATIHATAVADSLGELLTSEMKTQIANGLVFLGLGEGTPGVATTLQGVGFQGTGAVDEIVWTDDDPFPAASTVAFTLTWTAGEVASVSYTIDGTTTSVADLTSGTTSVDVAPGTVVTVAATAVPWYTVSAGTGDVTVDAEMTQAITTALAATPADAGATGLPASITTANAKAWADAKSLTPAQIAACSFAEKAYLLNTDLTVEPTFAITAIEEVTGGWKITVEAKSGSNTVDLEAINGTLKVKTGATLEALASATSTEIPAANLTFDADGKAEITITGTGKNFIKATVE